jgi:twitching motility protein PilT
VITIEDPVEFLFRDKKCTISQREIGLDTATFSEGLKHILRQDPDVIMIGEIRDADTMRTALMAADTGHLVLSTLHTVDATQTVNRIISFFPPHEHEEVRFMLAGTLQAVIALRLVPRSDLEGRIPAAEVMLVTGTIREYLLDPEKTSLIKAAIAEGVSQYGMQTFDQSIMKAYTEGKVTMENALRYCSNPTEFELRVKGIHATSDESWKSFERKEEVV